MTHQIRSDGTTVWVDVGAYTVARFGKLGIDVHTPTADGCLHCTHEPTTIEDWRTFQKDMSHYYGIVVGDGHMPWRFREQHQETRAVQHLLKRGQDTSSSVVQEATAAGQDGPAAGI
jgi:hypothetical protein